VAMHWKRVSCCSTSGASEEEPPKNNDAVADANYGMTSRGAGAQCSRANMHHGTRLSVPISACFAIVAASLVRRCVCPTPWSLCPDRAPHLLPPAPPQPPTRHHAWSTERSSRQPFAIAPLPSLPPARPVPIARTDAPHTLNSQAPSTPVECLPC
jgi:hypothetical protein